MKIQKTLINSLIIVCGMTFMSCEKEASMDQIVDSETSELISAKAKNKCNVGFLKNVELQATFWNAKGKKLTTKIPESAFFLYNNNKEISLDFENKKFFNRPFFKSGVTKYGITSKKVLRQELRLFAPLYLSLEKGETLPTIIFPENTIDKKRSTKKTAVPKSEIFKKGERINYFTNLKKLEKRFDGITTQGVSPKKGCPRL